MSAAKNETPKNEVKNENLVESSFATKLNETDVKRTEIKFTLDFTKLDRAALIVYASREAVRIINNSVREKELLLDAVQGKTLEVEPLVLTGKGKGKVTPEKAGNVLMETYGISAEQLAAFIAEAKKNMVAGAKS